MRINPMLMYDAELMAFVGAGAVLVRKILNRIDSEYPDWSSYYFQSISM